MRTREISRWVNLLILLLMGGMGFPHPPEKKFLRKPPPFHFTAEIQIQETMGEKTTIRRWVVRSLEHKFLLADPEGIRPTALADLPSRRFMLIHPKEKLVVTVNPPPLFLEKPVMWIGRILTEKRHLYPLPRALKKILERVPDSELRKIVLGRPPDITEVWVDRESGIPVRVHKKLPDGKKVTVQILRYDAESPLNPEEFHPPADFRQIEMTEIFLPHRIQTFLTSHHLPYRLEEMEAKRLQHFQMDTGELTRIFYVAPDRKRWVAAEVRQGKWDVPFPPLEAPLQQFRPLTWEGNNKKLEMRTNIPASRANRLRKMFEGVTPYR